MKLVPLFPDPETMAMRSRRRRRLRISLTVLGAVACVVGSSLIALRELWPQTRIELGTAALAKLKTAPVGEQIVAARVIDASGRPVEIHDRSGVIDPVARIAPGTKLTVTATIRRSKWIGWLVGKTERVETRTQAPSTFLRGRLVYSKTGRPVRVRFSAPVRVLAVTRADGKHSTATLHQPRRLVSLGILASGADAAGTALVSAAARGWEALPRPQRVSWFPAGPDPQVLVRPAPKTTIAPSGAIVLTFSRPVADVLGDERPQVKPTTPGAWREPNDHTLVFDPAGLGFPLGKSVHILLPRAIRVIAGSDPDTMRTLTWNVPRGSTTRLEQLLSELGYLPFTWTPAGTDVPRTLLAQARAASEPPAGTLTWRYAKTPVALRALWASPTGRPVLIRGAIMAFESTHGMPLYPYATRALWRAVLRDEVNGRTAPGGYSYVYVTETLPETLTLWHNGRVVLRAAVNTGIASRPTALGTYPVYLHLTETTMAGTNPDGTHYRDPGVPWVNYFNGGDAVHGFVRSSYGYPQSLGCVEAPISTAGQIFPYVNVGTLVTVSA
jgi:L,D-transpeptidase catalytic domain